MEMIDFKSIIFLIMQTAILILSLLEPNKLKQTGDFIIFASNAFHNTNIVAFDGRHIGIEFENTSDERTLIYCAGGL